MTLLADDPRTLEACGTGGVALRWSLAAVTVAVAYTAAVWLAFALPDPEGAKGEVQDAVMIELEPLTALEEAPPPAPEPEAVAEPSPAPVEPPVAEAPIEEVIPKPPPPEPVAEEPPQPEPVVSEPPPPEPVIPEPVIEPPPPVPVPAEEPKPLPEPTTQKVVPDLIETDTIAAAVLNPPAPKLRPPPRPVEKAERKPKVEKPNVVEKPRRKAEPVKKPDRPRETRTPPRSSAARSDASAASRSASAPRVSSASWQRQAVSHFRKFRRVLAANERGTALVSLTIDRGGRVLSARLASSSGNPTLDAEAVALVRRASPIPAPPEGVGGRTIPLNIPINLR